MKPWESPPPIVQEADAEERQLVAEAKEALSTCHFTVGRCAQQWTARYALGRTDAAFGEMIGMSPDMVQKCRRVHELFHEWIPKLKELTWSHYNAATTWDDAEECLRWADENQASVAEMKAWRRSRHPEEESEPNLNSSESIRKFEDDRTDRSSSRGQEKDSDHNPVRGTDETPRAPAAGNRNRGSSQQSAASSGSDSPAESAPVPSQKSLLQSLMELLTKIEETASDADKRKIAAVLKEWASLIKPASKPKKQKFDPKSVAIPQDLITGSFPRMWENWIEHREEIKKPLTQKAAEMALKKLEAMGSPRAVAALQHSIGNGWQGIFEPSEKPSGAKEGRNRDAFDEVFGGGDD